MTGDQTKIGGSKIWSVQESVFRKLASDIGAFDVVRKAKINNHIIGKLAGRPIDNSVLAEPSELGEFCFRLSQVIEALLAFERMAAADLCRLRAGCGGAELFLPVGVAHGLLGTHSEVTRFGFSDCGCHH